VLSVVAGEVTKVSKCVGNCAAESLTFYVFCCL